MHVVRLILGALGALIPMLAVSNPDCVVLEGTFSQGGLIWGRTEPDAMITANTIQVPIAKDGRFIIGLGRDAPTELIISREGAGACTQTFTIARREYRIQRIEGVPQRTVTPPPEDAERIRRERALVQAAKAERLPISDGADALERGFTWPVKGRISGVYGSQRVYNGTPGAPHYGVDVAVPTGTPVRAPASGVITLAEPDLYYSGGTVILDHGYGLSSSFLHLSKVHVTVGQRLAVGDLLGEVGATGRATGPHLDWRMSWLSERIDPQFLVPPMPN